MATLSQQVPDVDPIERFPSPLPPDRRMTEVEFEAWYRGFEKVRAEWVDGEVVVMSPVNLGHLRLGEFLFRVLGDFVEAHDLGEVHGAEFLCRFQAGSRLVQRLPDLWFVVKDRLALLQSTYFNGAPDLVIEIVSPDSLSRDYREKYLDYQSGGVREYWVVNPLSNQLQVWMRDTDTGAFKNIPESNGQFSSTVLPGFFLRPEWLWREPLPKVMEILRALGV